MTKLNKEDMIKILMDNVGITEESLKLSVNLCGDTPDVYRDILFITTGYSSFDKYVEEVAHEK
jgi:hypothetical protein